MRRERTLSNCWWRIQRVSPCRIYDGAPEWWIDAHPEDLQTYHDGVTNRKPQGAGDWRREPPTTLPPSIHIYPETVNGKPLKRVYKKTHLFILYFYIIKEID